MSVHAFFVQADGLQLALTGASTRVGRSDEADIVLQGSQVSRFHAEVVADAQGYTIADLQSRNGTFVNGEPLGTEPMRLDHNDVVVFAGVERLVFQDPMTTPASPSIGRLVGVWIDPSNKDVWVDAAKVEPPLSARQLALLECLYEADGGIVTRASLVDQVWADVAAEGVSDDALAAAVKRVRARLKDTGLAEYIEVIRNRGIRLNQPKG